MDRRSWMVVVLVAVSVAAAQAQGKGGSRTAPPEYDELYERYLRSARQTDTGGPDQTVAWMVRLSSDDRARRVNDLVTIRVVESIAATGSAASSTGKKSSAAVPFPKFFGLEGRGPGWIDPASSASVSSDTQFSGNGTTSRASDLSAVVTARVVDVLPNGNLLLEAAREIEINGDRQIVVLTGVLSTADIMAGNVAFSTSIGQLRIRYFGKGLIHDNLSPGWLVRLLNKLF